MALPPRFLEELRGRLSIIDVVGRRVRLIRKGRGEATGLCPFHNEKTPSFTVSEDKGFYHCFGCGAHGDVIGFVMQSEGLEFRDAVERLAGEAGLEVPRETPQDRERAERQATLGGVVEFAAKFFEQHLRSSAGRAGLDYVKLRDLTDETIRRFRLGFAPDSRHGLKAALEKAGIPEAIAIEAGLLIKPEDGGHSYDRFRGRVMFPILDRKGQVIAFGGRIIGDGEPKYLNSPETPLFHKGRVLFGLSHAQKVAREKNEIIVVEGYMDVIGLAQAGFANAVAPLGTALTEEQIELLWRVAQEPILCFDGDAAGARAASRAAQVALPLLRPGLSVRFARIGEGGAKEDPDSIVKSPGGVSRFREILDDATPLQPFYWQLLLADRQLGTPERRAKLRQDIFAVVNTIADVGVRDEYKKDFLKDFQSIDGALSHVTGQTSRRRSGMPTKVSDRGVVPASYWNNKPIAHWRELQSFHIEWGGEAIRANEREIVRLPYHIILAAILHHPHLLDRHLEQLISLSFPDHRLDSLKTAIIEAWQRNPEFEGNQLWSALTAAGHGDELAWVSGKSYYISFTLPSADHTVAEEGFLHVIEVLEEKALKQDLDRAAEALARDMSETNWQKYQELKAQMARAGSLRATN